jgi:phospholipid/cholesterol/gamma-HCH transport system ATP-binding protein
MQQNLVDITNLRFQYENKCIFNNLNIQVQKEKITAIMGPSGTGKTTLLRLIGGLMTPDSGTVLVNRQNIHKLSGKELAKQRNNMGMLFQNGALFTDLSVFENVAFPVRWHTNLHEDILRNLVLMKLESVGLRGACDLMPSQLSGGMARRVALARAMALDPQLMMYDEPFTGQDPITKGVLVKLIKRLNQLLKITSIIVSHDVKETCEIADYIYVLASGKIIGCGTPAELLNSKEPAVKQFMHGEADGSVPFNYPAKKIFTEDLIYA